MNGRSGTPLWRNRSVLAIIGLTFFFAMMTGSDLHGLAQPALFVVWLGCVMVGLCGGRNEAREVAGLDAGTKSSSQLGGDTLRDQKLLDLRL